ncbi:MAG TPA: ATP-binding protein [Oligoflexus sp.]|uniref:ATP-binding protein n=1 Tax=Oligoflexus sp. TaxID=1971216 RepID=UPI002D51385B|nr:ATP-binding protein [Oligoflexus sp.]HYX36627.1 ATP-binding protein [Oligoflexus sp.]
MSIFPKDSPAFTIFNKLKIMGFAVLLSFGSSPVVLAKDSPSEAALIQKIVVLEDRLIDNPREVLEEVKHLIQSMDATQYPHALLRAQLFALEAAFSSGDRNLDIRQIDSLLEQARKLPDMLEAVRLIVIKAAIVRETDAREKSLEYLAEAEKLCTQSSEKALCSRIWRDKAYYHYLMAEYPKALEHIHKALSLIDKDDPALQVDYQTASNTLAIILDTLGDFDKALPLYERVYKYFSDNHKRYYSSVLAYNIAKGILLNTKGIPRDKALPYFMESAAMAEGINDVLSVAWARMGIGEYYIAVGQYEQALEPLRSAAQVFARLSVKPQVGDCSLLLARAYLKLKNVREMEKELTTAKENIPTERQAEMNEIRRSDYELAKLKGDFTQALEHLESYNKAFEEKAEKDQQNQLNSLRVTLGLEAEEQRSDALKREIELKQKLLNESETITYLFQGLFAASILSILSVVLVVIQQRRNHKRRLWMEQVLDSIDEGVVTIGRDLRVQSGFSNQVIAILGLENQEVAGASMVDLVFQKSRFSSDERALFLEVLKVSLDGGELGWDLNGHQLPSEIALNVEPQRIISASWQPIYSGSEIVRFIVVIKDITEKKMAELELIQRRELQAKSQVLLEEVLGVKMSRGLAFIQDMNQLSEILKLKILDSTQIGSCLRELHTRKGIARTLGLRTISDAIHSLESSLVQFQKMTGAGTDVQRDWQALLHILHEVDDLLSFSRARSRTEENDHLFNLMADLSQEAERQLIENDCVYEAMVVEDGYHAWTAGTLAILRNILVHAVANSADHGFIRAKRKGRDIRPARFSVSARRVANMVHVTFEDNGIGLDRHALQKLADARGFVPKAGQSIVDVVFLDGVSTAESVTTRSGRGVGMAAIREICVASGGSVSLSERKDSGVTLELAFPCDANPQNFSNAG